MSIVVGFPYGVASREYIVGGVRRESSGAMIIVLFINESVLGNLDIVFDVLAVFVIVKELGVVSDVFFNHFEVFLVLDGLLGREHTD